jgi:hypothetical protein
MLKTIPRAPGNRSCAGLRGGPAGLTCCKTSLAPVGVLRGQEAVSYDLALPPLPIAGGRVRLRLDIVEAGGTTRSRVAGEVEAVELRYVPITK